MKTHKQVQGLLDMKREELEMFKRINVPEPAISEMQALVAQLEWVLKDD